MKPGFSLSALLVLLLTAVRASLATPTCGTSCDNPCLLTRTAPGAFSSSGNRLRSASGLSATTWFLLEVPETRTRSPSFAAATASLPELEVSFHEGCAPSKGRGSTYLAVPGSRVTISVSGQSSAQLPAFSVQVTLTEGPPGDDDGGDHNELANAQCSGAVSVGSLPYQVTVSTCQTREQSELAYCSDSDNESFSAYGAWYRFNGTGGEVMASTCGSALTDTAIEVFASSCPDSQTGSGSCVASNDNTCLYQSLVSINTVKGEEYYVFVHGWGQSCGRISLVIKSAEEPTSQKCSDAVNITSSIPWSYTGDTSLSSSLHSECRNTSTSGQWFRGIGTGRTLVASTCSSNRDYDTMIEVYLSCSSSGSGSQCVSWDDDLCSTGSQVSFSTEDGVPYYIYVSGYENQQGTYTLSLSYASGENCGNTLYIDIGEQTTGQISSVASYSYLPTTGTVKQTGLWYIVVGDGNTLSALAWRNEGTEQLAVYIFAYCYQTSGINVGISAIALSSNTSYPQATWASVNETVYFIYVKGSPGNISLSVNHGKTESHSNCQIAAEVTSLPFEAMGDTRSLTTTSSSSCASGSTAAIWYHLNGTGDRIYATTCYSATDYDTVIEVFSSCSNESSDMKCVVRNDNYGVCAELSLVVLDTVIGQEYWIAVRGVDDIRGVFWLDIEEYPSAQTSSETHNPDGPGDESEDDESQTGKHTSSSSKAWIAAPVVGGVAVVACGAGLAAFFIKKRATGNADPSRWFNLGGD